VRIDASPTRIDFRAPIRPPGYLIAFLILSSAAALVRGEYVFVAVVWTVGIPLALVSRLGIRVSATEDGIRISNWWRPRWFSWREIDGFETVKRGPARVGAVRLRDGRVVRISATGGTGSRGASQRERERVLAQFELMRDRSVGAADTELVAALDTAKRGDPRSLDHLLAAHKVSPGVYTEQLHRLAAAGEVDMEALRRERRNEPGDIST
jgi:hypothetical protein